jgi:ABC-2 type transport system permease protein
MNFYASWIAFYTIVRKEVSRFMRIWSQTLLPPVINQTLYFVIFGTFIGSRVGDIGGVSYMAFIVPGLVMMAVINSAFANVVSSFFGSKFQKCIEELLVSPTPNWIITAGYVIGGMLRGVLVGLIVLAISAVFTLPTVEHPWIVLLFMSLTALVFALAGLTNAIFATKFDDISVFSTFVLTPLSYLGGVFYSIKDFSEPWQTIARFNPILYLIDGFRYGFYGVADVLIVFSIGVLLLMTVGLIGLNLYLLKKGTGMKA